MLVLAVIVFAIASPGFMRPQALSLLVQEMAVVGTLAVGPDTDHPDRRHRPVDRAGHGAVLAGHGQARLRPVAARPAGPAHRRDRGRRDRRFNGLLVTRLNLPPFIVTLGSLGIFTAISLLYAQGQTIALNPNSFLLWTGKSFSIGSFTVTYGVLLMLVLYAVVGFALRYTAWGRHLYATGDDAEAAELAGIKTKRVLLSAYLVAGFAVAVAAWILCGRVGGADPNSGLNANLLSITAVVIGGTSLFGGRGVVVGSLIGALIVQVFNNGLALANVDPNYQVLATGVLVIVAVSVDQWIRRVKA